MRLLVDELPGKRDDCLFYRKNDKVSDKTYWCCLANKKCELNQPKFIRTGECRWLKPIINNEGDEDDSISKD